MIRITDQSSSAWDSFIIQIGGVAEHNQKLRTVHTMSTIVTLRLYPANSMRFTINTGINYIRNSFREQSVSLVYNDSRLRILFAGEETLPTIDEWDTDDPPDVKIYTKKHHIGEISIAMNLLPIDEARQVIYD